MPRIQTTAVWVNCAICSGPRIDDPNFIHECGGRLVVNRPKPGLYKMDNGLQLVMGHGSLFVRFPVWMGRAIWRWRQHLRARRNDPLALPDLTGLPTTIEALRGLFARAYKEHDDWRAQFRYKGVDVRADRGQHIR